MKQRDLLLALPKFMYEPTEQEVRDHKAYPQCVKLAEQLVQLQNKLKVKLMAYDMIERKTAKALITEETGLTFEFQERK
jgi:hypothetical protein